MSHFQDDITLDKIASLACMTPNAFCHFFKQRTNKTFFQFLIELRVAHACQLIIKDHDLTMADISSKSGFKSISNFNRKFKQLKGSTPSQYFQRQNVLGV
jgi:AraC-like DNA-binding protein